MNVLAHKGRLVCVNKCTAAIEIQSLTHHRQSGFCDEADSRSKLELTSKLSWSVEEVKQCVDDTTGLDTLFVLVSCQTTSGNENRFCVNILKATRRGGTVLSYSSKSSRPSGKRPPFQLTPVVKYTCSTIFKTPVCALAYGPRVVVVERNKLLLVCENTPQTDAFEGREYRVCDIEEAEASMPKRPKHGADIPSDSQTEARMLCVASDKCWIVSLILISGERWSAAFVAVALEKQPHGSRFERVALRAHNFVPQQYASKVSAVTIQACKRTRMSDQPFVYENICAVGLDDGYVMIFANGIMQTCVALGTQTDSTADPATVLTLKVKQVMLFKDMLVCHTDAKECFAVSRATNKVIHQWSNVHEPLIGDFLHNGGKQLLLLFDGWMPWQPQSGYLLTDLQGFVEDRRETEFNSSLQEDGPPGNLQRVVSALQEQNQTLARRVAEEEQKLAAKQLFLSDAWKRLQDLSCHGPNAVPNISPPEVPLVSLLGTRQISATRGTAGLRPEAAEDINVLSVWHRIMDCTCVVGVRILNNSTRNLTNCTAVLTSRSAPNVQQRQLTAHTRLWRFFRSVSAACPKPADVDHQVAVRHTEVVRPSESVTVTCSFDVPDLGLYGEMQCFVYLQFSLTGHGTATTPGGSTTKSRHPLSAGLDPTRNPGGVLQEGKDSPGLAAYREMAVTKHVSCGSVTVKASDMLLWRKELDPFAGGCFGNSPGVVSDDKLEEQLLLLNSVQQPWTCCASFALHEVTQLTKCLQDAGFVLHWQLGQYVASSCAPEPLRFTRVQVQTIMPLPARAVNFVLFVRDSNQLLLFLRHLYSHLPTDATITLETESRESPFQHLVKVMAAELHEKNRLARAVRETHSARKELSADSQQRDARGIHSQQTGSQNKEVLSSEVLKSERECFEEQQKLYCQSLESCVYGEDIVRFEVAVKVCEMETDLTVAKMKS